jgi:hypothetical protein
MTVWLLSDCMTVWLLSDCMTVWFLSDCMTVWLLSDCMTVWLLSDCLTVCGCCHIVWLSVFVLRLFDCFVVMLFDWLCLFSDCMTVCGCCKILWLSVIAVVHVGVILFDWSTLVAVRLFYCLWLLSNGLDVWWLSSCWTIVRLSVVSVILFDCLWFLSLLDCLWFLSYC